MIDGPRGVYAALGMNGQSIFVHRPARIVIAKFSTFPDALDDSALRPPSRGHARALRAPRLSLTRATLVAEPGVAHARHVADVRAAAAAQDRQVREGVAQGGMSLGELGGIAVVQAICLVQLLVAQA